MIGREAKYVNSLQGLSLHTSHSKDVPYTDRSGNCIQWIIKLQELRHSCPDDRGGGEGMWFGPRLNARRVPMQFFA